jgi:hypothetical protein
LAQIPIVINMNKKLLFGCLIIIGVINTLAAQSALTKKLIVSSSGCYLQFENGDPFFGLGDTGWLLFKKLNREEAKK